MHHVGAPGWACGATRIWGNVGFRVIPAPAGGHKGPVSTIPADAQHHPTSPLPRRAATRGLSLRFLRTRNIIQHPPYPGGRPQEACLYDSCGRATSSNIPPTPAGGHKGPVSTIPADAQHHPTSPLPRRAGTRNLSLRFLRTRNIIEHPHRPGGRPQEPPLRVFA